MRLKPCTEFGRVAKNSGVVGAAILSAKGYPFPYEGRVIATHRWFGLDKVSDEEPCSAYDYTVDNNKRLLGSSRVLVFDEIVGAAPGCSLEIMVWQWSSSRLFLLTGRSHLYQEPAWTLRWYCALLHCT